MLNLLKASLLGVLVCCLVVGTLGCRKKGRGDDGMPEEGLGEIEKIYDIEIGEGEWDAPSAISSELAEVYQTVYFDLNKSTLRPASRAVLEAIADDMRANRHRFVRTIGHCCDRGTNEYNFGLGERRAESVKAYLVALGVDPGRIRTLSKGEEEPAVPNIDESHRAQNRRVEFWLVEK